MQLLAFSQVSSKIICTTNKRPASASCCSVRWRSDALCRVKACALKSRQHAKLARQRSGTAIHYSVGDTSPSNSGALAAEIKSCPAKEVADTIWASILASRYDPAVLATALQVATEEQDKYDIDSLVAILAAQAHVGHQDKEFVIMVAKKLTLPEVLSETTPATLVQAVWTIAMMDSQGMIQYNRERSIQKMVLAVAGHAYRQIKDFSPDDVARLLASLAELNSPVPPALLDAVKDRLLITWLPLSQVSAPSLAMILWALTRVGMYDRALFDGMQAELQRKADKLSLNAISQVAWAHSAVRDRDTSHRAVFDVNVLTTLAQRAAQILEPLCQQTGSTGANTTTAATRGSGSAVAISTVDIAAAAPAADASLLKSALQEVADSASPQQPPQGVNKSKEQDSHSATSQPAEPVVVSDLLTVLLAYANLSHHDKSLCHWAAKYLAKKIEGCSAQDLVVVAFVYSRFKQAPGDLLQALAVAVEKQAGNFDVEDLVYLASLGPATGTYNEQLVRSCLQQAMKLVSCADQAPAANAASLLDLARCVAAVSHHNPPYYEAVQHELLRAVNAAQRAANLEDMSTHCGSTNPNGLQK